MYSPEFSLTDSPLSIASMFRRQATALGITASSRQSLAPLAPIEHPAAARDGNPATVADFVHDAPVPERRVNAKNDRV